MSAPIDDIDDITRTLAYAIDPVLWASEVLHQDPDDWQCDIIRGGGVSRLVLASRQSGKSHTTAIRALHEALFCSPAMILLASPTEDQSKELFRKLTAFYDALRNPPRPSEHEDRARPNPSLVCRRAPGMGL